ncbi:HSF-type DNA-binding-domain-containing protein [Coniochaeta sp. 2T2.1]|nr:HSF-type DNA-binding-domain-containing protein [Coniochaeta sp. 2T2.1]
MTESAPRNLMMDRPEESMGARTVPILTPTIQMSAPSPGEPMEITTPTNSSAPASATKSPESDANGLSDRSGGTATQQNHQHNDNIIMPAPAAAAAAVHQPKIVQTAFIHKLYNMLEDKTISHLISWTPSSESFVMQPSHEFSKVLAQYFKHTNISSFVRQLNMYGFHKVSDVFHHGTPETAMWEFKHGNGNFKRGDLVGLREIKRRASRHALVHREYTGQPKPPSSSQPGTPAEPMPPMPEAAGERTVESTIYDLSARLQRSEENAQFMHIKQQAMMDTVTRLLHFNQELTRAVLALAPNPDTPVHRDVMALQGEIQRQAEMIRTLDEPHEPLFASSRPYFTNLENPPVSPRQMAVDDARRSQLGLPQQQPRPPNFYRPPVPSSLSNLSLATRRPYGSIGGGTTLQPSPPSLRPSQPPPPPGPHPLANVELPPSSLARRHTSADIRAHGWQANNPPPFPSSGPPSTQWPSSPSRVPGPDEQRIRDSLSTYSLQSASNPHSRPASPGPPHQPPPFANGGGGGSSDTFGSWSWNAANRSGAAGGGGLTVKDGSAPPTRRGSMAHILNPTDTAEREDEDEDDPRGEEDRKRKRLG